jgi:hypothetical protein
MSACLYQNNYIEGACEHPVTVPNPNCAPTTNNDSLISNTSSSDPYITIPVDSSSASLYPSGIPNGSCASPTGTGFDLRKGTVTMSGGVYYSPNLSWTGVGESEYTSIRYNHNVSEFLSTPQTAAAFIDTDSILRVRFKPRPQPKAPTGKSWCFGRDLTQASDTWGYTKLKFIVGIEDANGIIQGETQIIADVNCCTSTVDFSDYINMNITSNGNIIIRDVYSNQGCTFQEGCDVWRKVRDASCWQMDIEVQVDGTKSI